MTEARTVPLPLPRLLLLCSLILVALVVVGTVAWHHVTDAQAVAAGLEAARPWLTAWRAALFAILIALWPWFIDWLAEHYCWSDAHRRYVSAQRWRVAAWLLVIELVLVQNLVGRFMNIIS